MDREAQRTQRHKYEKVMLMWVKHCCYQRVSRTIIREINHYLGFASLLIFIENNKVWHCDTEEKRWKTLSEVGISDGEGWGGVMIGVNSAFLCGALVNRTGVILSYLVQNKKLTKCADLVTTRHDSGLVFNPVFDCVYLFGGLAREKPSISCSQFSLQTQLWTSLSNLIHPRYGFNPVTHSSVVFICGGGMTSVEVYDPFRDSFSLLSQLSLPQDDPGLCECAATIGENSLIILSERSLLKWDMAEKTLRIQALTGLPRSWRSSFSFCPPVIINETIYLVDPFLMTCRGVSLTTGAFRGEIRAKE